MKKTSPNHEQELSSLIQQLEAAKKQRNKKVILSLYDKAQDIDFSQVSNKAADEYDNLVDACNDIVYS
jgi:hypothetical protein